MSQQAEAAAVIARVNGRGNYDMPWETRLVSYKGKHYIVNDEWTGVGELRGEQYRPRVYAVPAGAADHIAFRLDNWREYDGILSGDGGWSSDAWAAPTTHGEAFGREVLPTLACLGEMGDHPWMQAL